MATKLSNNFTLEELTASSTAKKHGISNEPTGEVRKNLTDLCVNVLQPLRDAWGKPITVNCGYRSPAVNQALQEDYKRQGKNVVVAKNSQHCLGQAADITTGNKEDNKKLFDLAVQLKLPFDQLIDEYGYSWVHISYGSRHRRVQLHYK